MLCISWILCVDAFHNQYEKCSFWCRWFCDDLRAKLSMCTIYVSYPCCNPGNLYKTSLVWYGFYGMASASDITFVFCLFLFSQYFDQYQMPSICMLSVRYDNVLDLVHRLILVHNFGGYSVDIQSHATSAQCVCSEAENSAIEKRSMSDKYIKSSRTFQLLPFSFPDELWKFALWNTACNMGCVLR